MVKVSICIPTYNNVEAFQRCLNSVLSQDFRDFEIIISDDSNNNLIESLINETNFNEISYSYYHNTTPLKSPNNWNFAIQKAKGEYIKLLHHDDWFTYPNSLKVFVELLDLNPNASLGFVSSKNINTLTMDVININTPSKDWIALIENNPLEIINGNRIGAPSAVIHRNNIKEVYDDNLKWFVDIDFYVYLLKNFNSKVAFNSIDAISIGISDAQISRECENNPDVVVYEFFYFLNKWRVTSIFKTASILQTTKDILEKFNLCTKNQIREFYKPNSLPNDIDKILKNPILVYLKNCYFTIKKQVKQC